MPILGPQRDFNSHEGEFELSGTFVAVYWAVATNGGPRSFTGWWWHITSGKKAGKRDGPFLSSRDAYAAALYATSKGVRK